ncbi:hypothetical protein BY996DRAFT_6592461 [Phakopsora pachyrhizi]|nr:hypothetical protein BY996DRAFT_6592461 [Phakopsora pachyrhizi]
MHNTAAVPTTFASILWLLTQQISGVTTTSSCVSPAFKTILIKAPNSFDGTNPSKLRNFLQSCQLIFYNNEKTFSKYKKKVLYAALFLSGKAGKWIKPYITQLYNKDPTYLLNLKWTMAWPHPIFWTLESSPPGLAVQFQEGVTIKDPGPIVSPLDSNYNAPGINQGYPGLRYNSRPTRKIPKAEAAGTGGGQGENQLGRVAVSREIIAGPTKASIDASASQRRMKLWEGKRQAGGLREDSGEVSVGLVRRCIRDRRRTDIGYISKAVGRNFWLGVGPVGLWRWAVKVGRRARQWHAVVRSSYHFRQTTEKQLGQSKASGSYQRSSDSSSPQPYSNPAQPKKHKGKKPGKKGPTQSKSSYEPSLLNKDGTLKSNKKQRQIFQGLCMVEGKKSLPP